MQECHKQTNLANRHLPNITIVLLNYNGLGLLRKYLPSLLLYSDGYPIIVVDNASTDGSVDYLKTYFPEVQCIVHKSNYGVAKGYNIALNKIKATYYLLLNNDLLVTPDWLKGLVSLMEHDLSIACCQPKILSVRKPNQFDYAGAAGGFIDDYAYPFCRGRILNHIEIDNGQYNDTRPIFWASGACLLVRAKAFYALGGFDELFFAHFEEIDFCWRAHLSGWKVYYSSTSTVYHVGGGTLLYSSPRKTYLNFRNRLLLLYKYHQNTWKHTITNICLDLLAFFRMLFLGKFAHGWAILQAQIDFFKLKKECLSQSSLCSSGYLPHRYKGNILISFFIKKKKAFSQISRNKFT